MSEKAIALYFSGEDSRGEGVNLSIESAGGDIFIFLDGGGDVQSLQINPTQAAKLHKAFGYAIGKELEAIQSILNGK